MKRIHLNHIQSFCVISDVHLSNPNSALTQKFIKTLDDLNSKEKDIEAVILLGDIFDFIAAPVPFFLDFWKDVFESCKRLKERGIQVYLTEGNHDFGFEHFTHPRLTECFTKCGDFGIVIEHPKHGKILLKHGDEVVCRESYRLFRKFVKANWFQTIVTKLFSGSWMQFLFSRYARFSRKNDQYRTLSQKFMDEKISQFLNEKNLDYDVLIMGHVHQEIDHMVHISPLKNPVRLLIGQAWFDSPNILYVDERTICRKSII